MVLLGMRLAHVTFTENFTNLPPLSLYLRVPARLSQSKRSSSLAVWPLDSIPTLGSIGGLLAMSRRCWQLKPILLSYQGLFLNRCTEVPGVQGAWNIKNQNLCLHLLVEEILTYNPNFGVCIQKSIWLIWLKLKIAILNFLPKTSSIGWERYWLSWRSSIILIGSQISCDLVVTSANGVLEPQFRVFIFIYQL